MTGLSRSEPLLLTLSLSGRHLKCVSSDRDFVTKPHSRQLVILPETSRSFLMRKWPTWITKNLQKSWSSFAQKYRRAINIRYVDCSLSRPATLLPGVTRRLPIIFIFFLNFLRSRITFYKFCMLQNNWYEKRLVESCDSEYVVNCSHLLLCRMLLVIYSHRDF